MHRLLPLLVGILFLAALPARAGSAYGAMRVAQAAAPSASLVSVMGDRGEPGPTEWKLLYTDSQARGGVREIVVADNNIVSQRTPLSGYSAIAAQSPIKLSALNVDSDAAFKIANKQAELKEVGFSWADYSLRSDDSSGTPVWVLRLINSMGAQVGSITISAENGDIVSPLHVIAVQTESTDSDSEPSQKIGGLIGTVSNTVEKTANKVKNTTLRTVGNVQEFLTGQRTIGPKDGDDE